MAEKKGRGKIVTLVEDLLKEPVEKAGYLLWDVDFYKEGTDFNLLVTIENPDRQKPIDLDDCEKVSRLVSPLLDEADPIEGAYYLEVSSPGIERELRTEDHIYACEGWDVELRLFAPVDGTKVLRGVLGGLDDDGNVVLIVGEEEKRFPRAAVAKLQTVFDFGD